ncbi:MAG: hypothetical protein R3B70_28510 [Polyangiaceae bacterium]
MTGETTGTGGGTTSSAGGGGTGGADCVVMEAPLALLDTFCDRFRGLREGPVPVDPSRAHALARFWGLWRSIQWQIRRSPLRSPRTRRGGRGPVGLRGLAGGGGLFGAGRGGSLGEATVESLGAVAVVVPGTGPVELPAGTEAVLVDLRGCRGLRGCGGGDRGGVSRARRAGVGARSACGGKMG